jgi:hypothetical protein
MELRFTGELWYWKGPSPYHFISTPDEETAELESISGVVSYGWGMIPVAVEIGSTRWTTALFPKDGSYLVPVKDMVRNAEGLEIGDKVAVKMTVDI